MKDQGIGVLGAVVEIDVELNRDYEIVEVFHENVPNSAKDPGHPVMLKALDIELMMQTSLLRHHIDHTFSNDSFLRHPKERASQLVAIDESTD